mmetsp:Transcript_22447/g.64499  ORF Transcript_22447/g.64499 Transcript_22447/m.64499 type:complete len:261 (+) Transcript_22447:3455-4237(+)
MGHRSTEESGLDEIGIGKAYRGTDGFEDSLDSLSISLQSLLVGVQWCAGVTTVALAKNVGCTESAVPKEWSVLRNFVGVHRGHHKVATNLFLLRRRHRSVLTVSGRSVGFPLFGVGTGHDLAQVLNVAAKGSNVLIGNVRNSSAAVSNLGLLLGEYGIDSSSDGSPVFIGTLLVDSLKSNVRLSRSSHIGNLAIKRRPTPSNNVTLCKETLEGKKEDGKADVPEPGTAGGELLDGGRDRLIRGSIQEFLYLPGNLPLGIR